MGFLAKIDTFQGDTLKLQGVVNKNILNWEIRAELWDNQPTKSGEIHIVRKATSNVTGGAANQILVIDGPKGKFTLNFAPGDTNDFKGDTRLEIQLTDLAFDETTIFSGFINIQEQRITWTSV